MIESKYELGMLRFRIRSENKIYKFYKLKCIISYVIDTTIVFKSWFLRSAAPALLSTGEIHCVGKHLPLPKEYTGIIIILYHVHAKRRYLNNFKCFVN